MAKLNKKGISTLLVLLSLTMFTCTIRMAQKDSTYIDMGKAHLLQLETPADDAPTMIVHTSVGDITAVLYPEAAPNYVAQFTELVEKGYYDGTYVYQTEPGVYFRAGRISALYAGPCRTLGLTASASLQRSRTSPACRPCRNFCPSWMR